MKPRILALIAVVFWSTAASAFKITLRWLTPFQLVLLASAVSTSALWLMILLRRKCGIHRELSMSTVACAAARGLLNPFLYYLILLEAYNELPAQIAMVINYLWPVALLFLSVPLLKQRITLKMAAASGISFCGVAVLAIGGNPVGGQLSLPAMGLALLSTVIWALFWILNVRASGDSVRNLAESFFFGLLYLLMYGVISGEIAGIFCIDIRGVIGSVYIGLFEMGITFVIWLKALEFSETTSEVGNLIYLTPFIALVFIGSFVGEKIGLWTIAGLLLVIGGIALQEIGKRRYQ
ncbi:MAG: DMT family transporter [Candidatus Aegiribacteria sp.]|nr:DMT family transporter [Candidatus Aegiribacteria sp.]